MTTVADKVRQLRDMFRANTAPWLLAQSVLDELANDAFPAKVAEAIAPRPEKTEEVKRLEAEADGFDPAYRDEQERKRLRNERDRAKRAANKQ